MKKWKAPELALIVFIIILALYLILGDTGVLLLRGPVSSVRVSVHGLQGIVEEPMGRLLKDDVVSCVVEPIWGSFYVYIRNEAGKAFTTEFRGTRWQMQIPEEGEYFLAFVSDEDASFDASVMVYTKP